jgi:hypothetical protein
MDAQITRGTPESFQDEDYRGYRISYERTGGIFYVSNDKGYCRGVGQTRKMARTWIDLLIAGKVK